MHIFRDILAPLDAITLLGQQKDITIMEMKRIIDFQMAALEKLKTTRGHREEEFGKNIERKNTEVPLMPGLRTRSTRASEHNQDPGDFAATPSMYGHRLAFYTKHTMAVDAAKTPTSTPFGKT
jgi:hypothetical protein